MPIAHLKTIKCNYLQLEPSSPSETDAQVQDVVMIHGLATNLAFWYPVANILSKMFKVTLFDLRGHGRSFMPNQGYTPKDMATDLAELLDLLNIKQAHFIGHSFGGSVALCHVNQYPQSALSLSLADVRLKCLQACQQTCNWSNWDLLQPILDKAGITIDDNEPEAGYRLLTEIARVCVDRPQLYKSLMGVFPQGGSPRTASQWLKLQDKTTVWQDFTKAQSPSLNDLQHMPVPTLGVYGEHSSTMPTANAIRELWNDLKFEIMPDAGHFFPISRPQEFSDLILQFII